MPAQVNGVNAIRNRMKEKNKGEDLTPGKVEESSKPAAELFRWVLPRAPSMTPWCSWAIPNYDFGGFLPIGFIPLGVLLCLL